MADRMIDMCPSIQHHGTVLSHIHVGISGIPANRLIADADARPTWPLGTATAHHPAARTQGHQTSYPSTSRPFVGTMRGQFKPAGHHINGHGSRTAMMTVLNNRPGQRHAEAAREGQHGRDHADHPRILREAVPDDPEGQQEQPPPAPTRPRDDGCRARSVTTAASSVPRPDTARLPTNATSSMKVPDPTEVASRWLPFQQCPSTPAGRRSTYQLVANTGEHGDHR